MKTTVNTCPPSERYRQSVAQSNLCQCLQPNWILRLLLALQGRPWSGGRPWPTHYVFPRRGVTRQSLPPEKHMSNTLNGLSTSATSLEWHIRAQLWILLTETRRTLKGGRWSSIRACESTPFRNKETVPASKVETHAISSGAQASKASVHAAPFTPKQSPSVDLRPSMTTGAEVQEDRKE